MQAVILAIGDELVLGQTVDTNSAYLSQRLAEMGIGTRYHQTVADEKPLIVRAIQQASESAQVVIVSGGIGPTEDDLTREALAEAMGKPLELDEEAVKSIEAFFAARGRPMPQRNRVQAMHPEDTHAIPNACGTAPGIRAKLNRATIYVTPGVPFEMRRMFAESIAPELAPLAQTAEGRRAVILTTKLNTFGIGESDAAERLGGELMSRQRNPKVGTTVADGIVSIRVRSEADDPAEARKALEATVETVKQKMGPILFGQDEQSLDEAVFSLLSQRDKTLTTVESCTGGLLGKMMTDLPGVSAVYLGGWVTYANEAKQRLGVPAPMLAEHGAVSEPVARSLAQNALRELEADFALSITGIAGPEGGTPEKPVGTVWVGLGERDADQRITTRAMLLRLPGDRPAVRDRSAKAALQMLRLRLLDEPLDLLSWGSFSPAQTA